MSVTADFTILDYDQLIGVATAETSKVVSFEIAGEPRGQGYMLLDVEDIQSHSPDWVAHLNGHDLLIKEFQPAGSGRRQTVFQVIPEGMLRQGENQLGFSRSFGNVESTDSFHLFRAVVHWRQQL